MSPFLLSLGQDGGFVPYKERIKAYFDRWPGAMEKFEACWLKHMHAVVFFQHIWHARVCVCVCMHVFLLGDRWSYSCGYGCWQGE